MNYFQAIILAIIEGLTEYLPVSSTGHLILGNALLGIDAQSDFVKLFIIAIQPGAIFAVLVLYWKRFFTSLDFYLKLLVAFIPAAILGLLLNDWIDAMLESPLTVAISLFLGGVFFLFVDKLFAANESNPEQEVSYRKALTVGFFQVLSMIPGTSRSGATIVGGLAAKLNRKNAAEFSFLLGVPTLFAATGYKLLKFFKAGHVLATDQINFLIVGNVLSFIVGMLAIKFLISYLSKNGFKLFGWYRIIVGGLIIIMLAMNMDLAMM